MASRSTVQLASAPASPCPHCGRTTKTVQGVCADCWRSKGGRLLGATGRRSDSFGGPWVIAAAALLAAIPAAVIVLSWILG
jgi:hypothetical protein